MNLDNLIGTVEAAQILGLSPDHVKKLCRDGKIESRCIGKSWVMDKNNLTIRKDEPTMYEKLNPTNSTIIGWKGVELRTVQDPYIDGEFYRATAIDKNLNEYEIEWEIIDFETDDESSTCDWYTPFSVVKL